ncbi:heparan-alpha-glucosaminide N-acetyltransferase domain-containing protein [Dyadobacter sp. LHD-138]|uniref:DUF1624 domain-containing protein n=1 Tax=Dyadobacter sp. LHD-138 TaxID=3071413 RepID=UPI0027DF1BB1|nr:heparan-alpha-glucosaminide N-acetyltransferase domain-containing protein [Dyadobacter sp. LHD-138]MDQ6480295.1 heparan-alpha-glucosaminide N-acetyltransferase domain-containing protein [Dyadobacter sp. LHD-138]
MKRIDTIDFTRGLVMIIMALDHVRDLTHTTALSDDPTNLDTTTATLFLTRWITHLCAPTFVFLSGASAFISLKNNTNIAQSRKFLVTRGLWLIVLEFTVITLGLWADIQFRMMVFQVIAAIGLGFIILSFLLKIPPKTLGILGLLIVCGHNLVQGVNFNDNVTLRVIWSFFFRLDVFPVTPNFTFAVLYPFLPWFGIMLTGYACGQIFLQGEARRRRTLFLTGLGLLAFFVVLRFANFYGDPSPWKTQKTPLFTLLSFINISKYPPSLLYASLTLGISFLVMALADGAKNKFVSIISVYGKVPLFYYLLHWYLAHSLMFALMFYQGFTWKDLPFGPFQFGRPVNGSGVALPYVYMIWAFVIIVLYPLCKWYSGYKSAHREKKWLRYI